MQDKHAWLVPQLRFPEFEDNRHWLVLIFTDLYRFKSTNSLSRDKLNYDGGEIRNIHYGDIHTKYKSLFRLDHEQVPYINQDSLSKGFDDGAFCEEGDIVLADASEDIDDVGKTIEVVQLDGKRVVAGLHTILATRRGKVPIIGFGGQLFQSATIRNRIKREAHGTKVYGISAKRVSTVPITIPPTKKEQKKIVDCLGSLDDIIEATDQKLKALRQNKKGLMQQLFPQPGETESRLRFPEFRDSGKWENKLLGELSHVVAGQSPKGTNINSLGEGTPFFQGKTDFGDIFLRKPTKWTTQVTKLAKPGDILLSVRAPVGALNITPVKICIGRGLASLQPKCNKWFLYYSLLAQQRNIVGSGGSVYDSINREQIEKLRIIVPPTKQEQKKIGDCLGFLDDIIEATGQKLEALSQNKKGLIQQLFPANRVV